MILTQNFKSWLLDSLVNWDFRQTKLKTVLAKGKVLSHKCRLILSIKELLGELVLKAPHLYFTERRHVRKEHTGKIGLDHGANITSQFQFGFNIHCT